MFGTVVGKDKGKATGCLGRLLWVVAAVCRSDAGRAAVVGRDRVVLSVLSEVLG